MMSEDMDIVDEREKLFNKVWKEPMITLAKRYGLSDNGLRKRCMKLGIPLPPTGYWAKLQAGKKVPSQPKLPPLHVAALQQKFYNKDTKKHKIIELIDLENQTSEQLKELGGMDLFTPESRESFLKWCSKIQIPKRIDNYDPLINDYQNEIAYRKARDEEHQFRDVFRYFMSMTYKIEYRNNRAVLPISVSDKKTNRALRIVDTMIKSVKELGGEVTVGAGENDNATFRIFDHAFSFQMNEKMVKRRSLLSNLSSDNKSMEFRPMYEKIYSGVFEIELKEILNYWVKVKAPGVYSFVDSVGSQIESQLGEIFSLLCKSAIEAKIANIIADRENEIKEKEQRRLRKIEEERKIKHQQLEEQNRRKQQLTQNIEKQLEAWNISQKLRRYADELEKHKTDMDDEKAKELLSVYITLVRQKADGCNPITDILKKVEGIFS